MPDQCLDLQVAYHGVPEKTYEVFVNALQSSLLSQGVQIPPLENHNPAGIIIRDWETEITGVSNYACIHTIHCSIDIIMDMLGDKTMRKIICNYYEESGEQDLVRRAVCEAWDKEQKIYNDEINANSHGLRLKIHQWR